MDIADFYFAVMMECHLLQCNGSSDLIIWSADTMTSTGGRSSIKPHVCRHTYCTNMARLGMNSKTL